MVEVDERKGYNVINIRFHEDLPTKKQNELRYRMELKVWKDKMKAAEAREDYEEMDRLAVEYEMVGLP